MNRLNFYPKLDSLRALAVILVIISHWFSGNHFFNRYTNNGTLGVTLFFVLSGFLITGILINYKTKLQTNQKSIGKALGVFYFRRSLRIFPIYYLLLIFILVTHLPSFKDELCWHFFYVSNVYFWIKGSFQGFFSHLWSLAVEEQFYLIWPLLILVTTIKKLKYILLISVLGAFLYRIWAISDANEMARFLLPGSFDSFAIGGIFAFAHKGIFRLSSKWMETRVKWILGFIFLAFSQAWMFVPTSKNWNLAVYLLVLSVAFGWMILASCEVKENQKKSFILENRNIMYLGKISYGLYLYHNFIPYLYDFEVIGVPAVLSLYFSQLLRFSLLILIASFSWFLIEKPLLKFKNQYVQF